MARLQSILIVVLTCYSFSLLFSAPRQLAVFRGTVLHNLKLSTDTHHLEISVPEKFPAQPGHAVAVISPADVKRFYSLSGLGSQLIAICVKRVKDGQVSGFLCDSKPGAELRMEGPVGKELLLPAPLPGMMVLFGTGTGLAPFRAILEQLSLQGYSGRVVLIAGARTKDTLPYLSYFEELRYSMASFELRLAVSHEGCYVQDKFTLDEANEWIELRQATIFVCGSKAMGEGVISKLTRAVGLERMREMKRSKRLRKEVY